MQESFNQIRQAASRREREFLESRLAVADRDLQVAQNRLLAFNSANQTFELDSQIAATVSAIGTLQGQLIAQQVELNAMLASQVSTGNPEVRMIQQRIAELGAAISRLTGSAAAEKPSNPSEPLGIARITELGVEYSGLLRDMKKHAALVTALTPQCESARLSEVRSSDAVTIIDHARVPDSKSGPPRAVIAILTTIFGFLIGSFYSLIKMPVAQVLAGVRNGI